MVQTANLQAHNVLMQVSYFHFLRLVLVGTSLQHLMFFICLTPILASHWLDFFSFGRPAGLWDKWGLALDHSLP